jgi:two-component system, NarL family, invasion response regulator UvrY
MPAILLIDDHEMIHRGIVSVLAQAMPQHQVICVVTADEGLRLVTSSELDAVIVDLNIPGRGGLDLIREIKRLAPKTPVLVHSMHGEEHFGVAVARAGAQGYVSKAEPTERIVQALETVIAGRPFYSQRLYEKLAVLAAAPSTEAPHEQLSDREMQVFRLIVAGRSGKEIAGELSLSPKTVSTYRTRLLEKLQLNSDSDLVKYALTRGLFADEASAGVP